MALFLIRRAREGIGRVAHAMLDKPKDAIAGYDASGSRLQWLHICACYGWAWGQEVFKMGSCHVRQHDVWLQLRL